MRARARDVVAKNPNGEGYIKPGRHDVLVVGVVSDNYATCIGGDEGVTPEEQKRKYAPIGLAGRVPVKVVGKVKAGDLLTSSDIPGVACAAGNVVPGTIVGKALENYDGDGVGLVEMFILNL